LKEEAICTRYLNDLCDDEDDCALLHTKSRMPYAWQYKKQDEAWKAFPVQVNLELEKAYCDPEQSNFE